MKKIKKGIPLLIAVLAIFLFIAGCDMNSKKTNQIIGATEPALEIAEVKNWNKVIGENVTLIQSRIELFDKAATKKFDINVNKSGNYYVSTLAGGIAGDHYVVVIDNSAPRTNSGSIHSIIKLTSGGWQSVSLSDADNAAPLPIYLRKGNHTISIEGEDVPNVLEIKVDTSMDRSMFQLDEYNNRIAMIKSQPSVNNSSAKSDDSDITRGEKGNPLYAYDNYYIDSSTASYTFRRYVSLTSGNSYTFETKQPSGAPAIDTVLYLYKDEADGTPGYNYSWVDDDGGSGTYSKLTVSITTSGGYYVMVRSYYGTGTTGIADIYKNGSLWESNIEVGGYKVEVSLGAGIWRNYFTANLTNTPYISDSYIWVTTGTSTSNATVSKFNDDFDDNVNYEDGYYDWGYMSRIRTNSGVKHFIIAKYGPTTTASWRVYSAALDTASGEEDPCDYYSNLKPIERIRSGAETEAYNCIAWSGGMTSDWVWPPDVGSPWYDYEPLVSFDRFYGNNPQRYSDAPTYTRNGATYNNSKVDLWNLDGSDDGYTHGSVCRLDVDGNFHGYDWESKLGDMVRIFHPREALSGTNGSEYGYISEYYTISSKSITRDKEIATQQESIDRGLTVIQKVSLTKAENTKVGALLENIPEKVKTNFNKKYEAWKSTWKDNRYQSNPRAYTKNNEYEELVAALKNYGKASWAYIITKHQEDGILVISLLKDLILPGNEDIMTNVRSANCSKARANHTVYETPTMNGNWTTFAKEIINSQL